MEHIFNCHGEWVYLAQALAALPMVGMWVRVKLCPYLPTHTPATAACGGKDA